MKINIIMDILNAEVLAGEDKLHNEVYYACGSDMMSDVLAFSHDQNVLLTGLTNTQVVRTAEMMDLNCIVFVRGKTPGSDLLDLAIKKDMVVLRTKYRMFDACGRLYANGLKGKGLDE